VIEIAVHLIKATGQTPPPEGQAVRVETPVDQYGRPFAVVYDRWYHTVFDTNGAVAQIAALADTAPICELGVGTGRLAIPLAENGCRVIGIDSSVDMLDQLQKADPNRLVESYCGDMAEVFDVISKTNGETIDNFAVTVCAYNTLLNLVSIEQVKRCFRSVAKLLQPDGVFVVETFVPVPFDEIPTSDIRRAQVQSDVPVVIETTFDSESQLLYGRHIELQEPAVIRPWTVLVLPPEQIDELAGECGFALWQTWSDWNKSAFTDASETRIALYRRKN